MTHDRVAENVVHTAEAVIDNGSFGTRTIRFETGRLARQAAGSVAAYLDDDTMLLSATTAGKHPKEHLDFFPLTVDVEERMYAAGRIPGSFFRREGRPTEDAILTCRLIDRPLRPTFAKGLRNEVQVVITVLALDPKDMYDVVAINAASVSTQLSGLPFSGPIGATRVALIDDQWVAFPTHEQLESAVFDMVVAGRDRRRRRRDHDGRGRGHHGRLEPHQGRRQDRSDRGDRRPGPRGRQAVHQAAVRGAAASSPTQAAKPTARVPALPRLPGRRPRGRQRRGRPTTSPRRSPIAGKQEREAELDRIKDVADGASSPASSRAARRRSARPTARSPRSWSASGSCATRSASTAAASSDIRTLSAEVEVLPRVHGSALFERGETQILGRHHAEHAPHGADARHAQPREPQALHAQLQLPALLDR